MPNDSLVKLDWAEKHLGALKALADDFIKSKPYSLRWEQNADALHYSLKGKMLGVIPAELPLLVGDIAHSARCALDYIIYRLSTLAPDDPGRRKIQFPIYDVKADFWNWKPVRLNGISGDIVDIVKSVSPHNCGGKNDPLFILHQLNNTDKHHALRVVVALGRITGARFDVPVVRDNEGRKRYTLMIRPPGSPASAGGNTWTQAADATMTNDEKVLGNVVLEPQSQINVDPKVATQIEFARGQPVIEGRELIPTLRLILDRVKEVVGKFP